jgi:hypothetical protein
VQRLNFSCKRHFDGEKLFSQTKIIRPHLLIDEQRNLCYKALASMDNSKDIILALLSGSVSLAGLLLIFSGFLFSQASGFDPDSTPDKIIDAYRNAARAGVAPFLMCLVLGECVFGGYDLRQIVYLHFVFRKA